MSNQHKQQPEFKLFVGNMPSDVSVEEIETLFSNFGEVVEVHIMSGNRSRSGQSSAFVKFTTSEACTSAITALNMKAKVRSSDSDFLSVKFAKAPCVSGSSNFICLDGSSTAASTPASTPLSSPSSTLSGSATVKLFVGGLPPYVDRDDLIAIFSPFGKVESVHLMNNNKSKSGQSCGFINFYRRSEAQVAIQTLAAKYCVDADLPPITVRFADTEEHPAKRFRGQANPIEDTARRLAEQAANEILLGTECG